MTDIEDLARRIKTLEARIDSRNAAQLSDSSIDSGDSSTPVADTVQAAADVTDVVIPGLQDLLDANEQRLQDNADAVAAAMDAADAAEAAGLQAGDDAAAAAADASEKAQQALDAATSISSDVYTGRAPTSSDAGKPGQGWFVWDSNYHVTAYYAYKDDDTKWVQVALDNGVFGNIDAGSITSGYLGAQRIAAGSLTAAVLAADTLTSREIGADAILARNIKAAEITGAKIAAATITGGNIAANTITAGNIKAGTITANEIAAGSITADNINLNTLNGKTINGVSITGTTVATAVDPVSNAAISLSAGLMTFSNTSSGGGGTIYAPGAFMRLQHTGPSGGITTFEMRGDATDADSPNPPFYFYRGVKIGGGGLYTSTISTAGNVFATGSASGWTIRCESSSSAPLDASRFGPATASNKYVLRNGSNTFNLTNNGDVYAGGNVTIMGSLGRDWFSIPKSSGYVDAALGVQARAFAGNLIMLRGQLNKSSGSYTGSENGVMTLPTGYRPSQTCFGIATTTAGNFARIRINPSGAIDIYGVTSGTSNYVILDGLIFATD